MPRYLKWTLYFLLLTIKKKLLQHSQFYSGRVLNQKFKLYNFKLLLPQWRLNNKINKMSSGILMSFLLLTKELKLNIIDQITYIDSKNIII